MDVTRPGQRAQEIQKPRGRLGCGSVDDKYLGFRVLGFGFWV